MVTHTDRQTHQFADGSEIEFTVRTSDPSAYRIVTADLARRIRSARRTFARDASTMAYGAFAPDGRGDRRQSTTTLAVPGGEVTVAIDASEPGRHAYLHALVRGAAAYAQTLHVDVGRASLLAALLLAGAVAFAAVGWWVLSIPLVGAGGIVACQLAVYWLTARGVVPGLSRIPRPGPGPR